ncbi:hyaluronate lyase [Paenibacillus sp. V4I3]|uniref:polysaccharide lyase family 8 super-sandwich domain-containing protein n=1 Tax=Paenibacillus sp. V4I3 TaxID=3042305 RepID=UPI002782CCE2|nr:polysaccharide lyase family 8 super-sandwich domain-containing protein [Paenibacillus sp. V4I3]MDQ0872413.1 hyaluronate lyase [Paenibacillus sp. V4I3]
MKRMITSGFRMFLIALLLFGFTSSLFAGRVAAADEYDVLRLKWKSYLLGGDYIASDPDISVILQTLTSTAQGYWDTMDKSASRTYLWSDLSDSIAGTDLNKSSFMAITYSRLDAMAKAYSMNGSSLYQETTLLSDIIGGLDWMYANTYNENKTKYGNWFDWEINVPLTLNNSTILLYDSLTSTQKNNYMNAINKFAPSATITNGTTATGANRVWKATAVGIRGIIVKDSASIASSRDALTNVFANVTSGDGFYDDGSFIQHTSHPYTGGYGKSLLQTIVPFVYLLSGSSWAITAPESQNLYKWVYDSFEPLMYKGAMMDMSRSREASRRTAQDHMVGMEVMKPIIQLAQFAPLSDANKLKSMVKYWIQSDTYYNFFANASIYHVTLAKQIVNDSSVTARGELVMNKPFPSMDRAVHLRPGFGFALSMSSSRIYNYESINNENLKGWYTSDGMTYLYNNDLGHYSDEYWALVNKYRLPGTTVDTQTRANSSGQSYKSSKNWVGGTQVANKYGVAGMELDAWSSTLNGKKSWFMFDDEIVALGAGITSTDNRMIETTIENRKINTAGDNMLTVNGVAKPAFSGWSETLNGVNWLHMAGNVPESDIGYYFPTASTIKGLREARTGAWSDVNTYAKTIDSTVLTRNFLTLWQEHGTNPSNASYAYVMLPNKTSAQVSGYAANPGIAILENSPDAQAVKDTTSQAVGANFWTDTLKTIQVNGSPFLTSNKKASVMTLETASDIEVGVSDPTQANTDTIQLEINRSASGELIADSGVTVTQLSPTIKLTVNTNGSKGRTFKVKFSLGAVTQTLLSPNADAYVRDGSYADTNYGTVQSLVTKKSTAGYNRYSYLRFDLSSVSGAVSSAKIRLIPVGVGSASTTNQAELVSDDTWIESSITWNNKPIGSTLIRSWSSMVVDTPVDIDVTAQVQSALAGSKMISIRVNSPTDVGSTGDITYGARENATETKRPVLVITQ